MSRWFRSEPMQYISLIINEDIANECVADLGALGVLQVTDLNPQLTPFQRRYVAAIKRCDDLERILRYFQAEIDKFDLKLVRAGSIENFIHPPVTGQRLKGKQLLDSLEHELHNYDNQLKELNLYAESLTREYNQKVEWQEVLEKARNWFLKDAPKLVVSNLTRPSSVQQHLLDFLNDEEDEVVQHKAADMELRFSSLAGVVETTEKARFERMIFRTTRGNCYMRFAEIPQPIACPKSGELIKKSVFLVFFKSQAIGEKLVRICEAFGAHRYSLPAMDHPAEVDKLLTENAQELVDARTVLVKNQETRHRLCKMLSRHVQRWSWIVIREKSVYHTLNMFKADVSGMLRGEGWVVADAYDEVKETVELAHSDLGVSMPSLIDHMPQPWPTPPTYFKTNKFTYAYQEFVNTYGIPRYREANPALFTAATFPFLFGVMYGDVGHGLFLFLAGCYLIWNEKANERTKMDEMTEGLHIGRYMFTMMGFFAMYAGYIYNDCFSLGFNHFGSRWKFPGQDTGDVDADSVAYQTADYGTSASVYPIGLDPVWKVSSNELLFFNSFKMKLSVIFGVIQMFCGTLLKGANAKYFGERLDYLYEFLPMVAFASSLFVYMVFLIFMKWSIDWQSRMEAATCFDPTDSQVWQPHWKSCDTSVGDGTCTPWGYSCTGHDSTADKCPLNYGGSGDGCQPPNLITTLINIALNPGTVDEPMYFGQAFWQSILLLIAFVSVPVLLVAKPYYMQQDHQYSQITHHVVSHADWEDEEGLIHGNSAVGHEEEEHGMGEVMIHQAIETIEFVLGMVSNTASYLRLWALSLAHSELATVFWDKSLLPALNTNFIAAAIGYCFFAGLTFGVLLTMDVLECFLHALRLHWVEFQNKFFAADGIRFSPFCFYQILKDA